MGADLSNCQLTKLGDACYSPFSMINTTLSEAGANNFVLNLESSRFESKSNDFWFSCMEDSIPYNGTLKCDVNNYATIVCGSKNITFIHRENCLFGFQFRDNETVIFDNADLQTPLLAFPFPASRLAVATQLYEGSSQEKWVLRSGFSGYVSGSGILSSSTIENPKSQETPFDILNKISQVSEVYESVAKEEKGTKQSNSFEIPVDQKKIESGGTLSFAIPVDKVISSNITLVISDDKDKSIVRLELSKCCGKLIDYNTGNYDVFSYPNELPSTRTVDLALTWVSSVYSLVLKSSNMLIAAIPTENESIPHKAVLLNTSKGEEFDENWGYYTGVRNTNTFSCTINKVEGKCKSASVMVTQMVNTDLEFLRFGFIFSKAPSLSPYEMTISQNSNTLATLQFSSNTININSNGKVSEVNLSSELKTGEWISGDIFIVSNDLHNVIETDNSIMCVNYSDSCVNSQNSQNWMTSIDESSILRYAYLKSQAVESQFFMAANNTSNSSTPNPTSEYYLYISFKNCIIAKLKINVNSFNKVFITDRRNGIGLAYWRLKSGISTSVNISTTSLGYIKEKIKKDINASDNKN